MNKENTPDPKPDFDTIPRDPKLVSDRELVYGVLHGLPGYEAEWSNRNDKKETQDEENFDGYDGNY